MAWQPSTPPPFFDGQEITYQSLNSILTATPFIAAGTASVTIAGAAQQTTTVTLPSAPAGRTTWGIRAITNNTEVTVAYTGGTTLAAKRLSTSTFTGVVTIRWIATAV